MATRSTASTGIGAALRMHRSDYARASCARAEWRHVLSILSCRKARFIGLTWRKRGGNGIYLGVARTGVPNEDVVCGSNGKGTQ